MIGSIFFFFLLIWFITLASIWTYFEDYYKKDNEDNYR